MRVKYLVLALLGYLLGRWTHVYLNTWTGNVGWFPHHWIIGLIMMIWGYFGKKSWKKYLFWFGIGMFVSDFDDFLSMNVFQPDVLGVKSFWQFN